MEKKSPLKRVLIKKLICFVFQQSLRHYREALHSWAIAQLVANTSGVKSAVLVRCTDASFLFRSSGSISSFFNTCTSVSVVKNSCINSPDLENLMSRLSSLNHWFCLATFFLCVDLVIQILHSLSQLRFWDHDLQDVAERTGVISLSVSKGQKKVKNKLRFLERIFFEWNLSSIICSKYIFIMFLAWISWKKI